MGGSTGSTTFAGGSNFLLSSGEALLVSSTSGEGHRLARAGWGDDGSTGGLDGRRGTGSLGGASFCFHGGCLGEDEPVKKKNNDECHIYRTRVVYMYIYS